MSTLKSSSADLTLNADGSGNDILFQSNASQVGSLTAEGLLTVTGGVTMTGTTPTLTIGDAGAEDTKIVFDGNAQDWHIGLDDSADDLVIGLGSTLGTTSHIVIDETGAVTKPLQPAFQAHAASTQTVADTTEVTVVLGTERFDIGGDFTSNTFTAPVAGKYQLNATFQLANIDVDMGVIEGKITTSNKTYYFQLHTASYDATLTYKTTNISALADMDASDTAYLQIVIGGGSDLDVKDETVFSGILVS